MKIPVAIIGCGAISQSFYAKALAALEQQGEVEVKALVDPLKPNVKALGKYFRSAKQYREHSQLSLNADWLLIVATPPRLHKEHSIYGLETGASVLCEKPMAATVADAEAMITAAERSAGQLAIGLYRRFFPVFEELGRILESRIYGDLQHFDIREGSNYRWNAASHSLYNPALSAGGVFFDVGVHVMDILLHLLGHPQEWTYADDSAGGLEANCRLSLKYASGVTGKVRMSKDWPTGDTHTFHFEKATITWPVGQAGTLMVQPKYSTHLQRLELKNTDGSNGPTEPQCFSRQIINVIDSKRGKTSLRVTAKAGIESLKFIESSYGKRTHMGCPWFSEAEQSMAEQLQKESAV